MKNKKHPKSLIVRIDPALHLQAKKYAVENEISLQDLIFGLLKSKLGQS